MKKLLLLFLLTFVGIQAQEHPLSLWKLGNGIIDPADSWTVKFATPFTLGSTSVTATGTQLNYLAGATGTTGTTTTNLVFSTSPVLVTPTLGVAQGTSLALGGATIGTNALAVTGTGYFSGNVKIGINDVSDANLESDDSFWIDIDKNNNNTDRLFGIRTNSATELFRVQENGFTGVGYTADPTSGNKFAVSGNSYFNGTTTSTGAFLAPTNSAVSPSYSFTSDPNSGMYSVGADQLGLSVNGTNMVTVTTTGVGVGGTPFLGATGADNIFTVKSSAYYASMELANGYEDAASQAIGFLNFIATANNATYKNVAGIAAYTPAGGTANKRGGELRFYTQPDNTSAPNNLTRMLINQEGNVGIGTTAPSLPLHIASATGAEKIESTTGTNSTYLQFTNTGGSAYVGMERSIGTMFGIDMIAYATVLAAASANPIQFSTNGAARMIINSSGNVGIGTTAPLHKTSIVSPTTANYFYGLSIVNANINKTRTTIAQSTDTANVNIKISTLGNPQFTMKGATGNTIFLVDSSATSFDNDIKVGASLWGSAQMSGTDAFTTTATTDTVTVTSATVNDIYTLTYITAVTAAEAALSVTATATGFIATRSAGTTSAASYTWTRQRKQ